MPVRSRGSTGRSPSARAVLAAALIATALASAVVFAVASPDGASRAAAAPARAAPPAAVPGAAPTDTQTPPAAAPPPAASDPTPTPAPPTLDPLPSGLVTRFPVPISGSATPGDVLQVSAGAATTDSSRCTATAGADGRWSCGLDSLPDGPGVAIRASSRSGAPDATGRVDVLSPPAITTGTAPVLITSGGVRGTAYPGAAVTVRADNGSSCSFPADSSGAWGCVLSRPLPSGPHTITASQIAPFSTQPSESSAPVKITVDTTAPAAPTIAPLASRTIAPGRITLAGSGEGAATVTVYASDNRTSAVVCSVVVSGTSWTCAGSLPAGSYLISALQRDDAGNVSAGSNAVSLTVAVPTGAPSSMPPSASPTSPQTAPAPAVPFAPPAPTPPQQQPRSPGPAAPVPPGPNWMATPFSAASAPVVSVDAFPGWLRSVLLALAAVLLLALPARLLAGTVARSRAESPRTGWSVFGRNRRTAELRTAETPSSARSPWLVPAGLAAAAALVTLSSSVADAGAYIRLVIAIVLALALVNTVWVVVARWLAPHVGAESADVVFRPAMLLIVAVAAVGSRIFDLHPALIFGLMLGVRFATGTGRVARGRIATAQLSALAAVGVSAWSLIGLLPEAAGDATAFLTEMVNAVALLSLGSAAVALLPVGGLAGRAVFQWSRLLWLGLGLVIYTLLFALLLPVASLVQTGQSTLLLVIGAFGFAVLCVCLRLWEKYVEPAL